MDPLSLVRQATTQNKAVNYTDHHYIFGNVKLHETTETAFKRTHKAEGYYTLRDIIFFLENAAAGVVQYRNNVREAVGVTAVTHVDSKDLKNYLTGQISSCPQIDQERITQQRRDSSQSGPSSQQPAHLAGTATPVSTKLSGAQQEARESILESFLQLSPQSFCTKGALVDPQMQPPLQPALSAQQQSFIKTDQSLLATLRADEFAASNRNSVMCKPGGDFSFVLKLVNDHVLKAKEGSSQQSKSAARKDSSQDQTGQKRRAEDEGDVPAKRSSSSSGRSRSASSGRPAPSAAAMSGTPIFIVPDALTATFSGFNATQFLRDGNFVPSDECRKRGLKRSPDGQRFSHTCKNGKVVEFKVVDNGRKLTADEWERVVVVFVQGQAWQFKGWLHSNPVDVFHKALGIHVCLDDGSEVSKNILSWKCQVLKIHKTRRHMDASAFNEFWILVEDYIRMHRPWLLK
mmetsp:Transcript_15704/g.26176  ORF Transcript_15704/g.26176 Transcript_15704/m.26176 type:complete len:460 (+) Transcript_15704:84-1463(+)